MLLLLLLLPTLQLEEGAVMEGAVVEDALELRIDPLIARLPAVSAAEELRLSAPEACPTCVAVRGVQCLASKRFVLRLALNGSAVTSRLAPAQIDELQKHNRTWRLTVQSAHLAPHEQHARSVFTRNLPLTASHDLNFGEGVENSKVWDVFGEFHTPFKFVFRGRTRFCIERTLPERR